MKADYINDKKSEKKRYSGRHKSQAGALALAVGLIIVLIFISLIPMSADGSGKEGMVPGLAFLNLLLSVCGMTISIRGIKNHAEQYAMGFAGLLINTIMFIGMVSIFFIGL